MQMKPPKPEVLSLLITGAVIGLLILIKACIAL